MIFNFQNFDEAFSFDPGCSYDDEAVAKIEGNRKQLEGLFIEKVMKLLGIKRRM
jgi:protein ELYS